ncbi:MAG: haloacid dehalogenase type II [bacterium]
MKALAFDVYGTLIDTAGVTTTLHDMVGDQAAAFSNLWRTKQLEYTWRYGLMGIYRNFRICTQQALDFSCEQLNCDLSENDKKALMQKYLELPVFDDVLDGLERLKSANVAMYAFSNGVPKDLLQLLTHAQVIDFMDGIVSVDVNKTFKPNPLVYQQFVEVAGTQPNESWLVSSNGFDVCGAVAAGMRAVWLQRNPAVSLDQWEFQPDKTVATFNEMTDIFI